MHGGEPCADGRGAGVQDGVTPTIVGATVTGSAGLTSLFRKRLLAESVPVPHEGSV
jgi:hypothetical protein